MSENRVVYNEDTTNPTTEDPYLNAIADERSNGPFVLVSLDDLLSVATDDEADAIQAAAARLGRK